MYRNYLKKIGIHNELYRRIWFIMRLTTFLLLVTFMQVSASSFAQKVSLMHTNSSLKVIFKELKAQTGYNFLYTERLLQKAGPVNIQVRDKELDQVLEELFANQPLTYEVDSKTVVIREKTPKEKRSSRPNREDPDTEEEQQPIRGRVVDENGEPLTGASIYVLDSKGKRTSVRTIADKDGSFQLDDVEEGVMLEVTYLGYKPETVTAGLQIGVLKLSPLLQEVNEVEVISTGYQQLPKERATGSFVQINNEMLNRGVGRNILDRLDGVTSGLVFNKNNPVGGNGSDISIRGRSTIFGNPNPLIVLDNFPYEGDVNSINPNDIASITILKDAAAASIWGTQAGNGVIVITTKKGIESSKPKFEFLSNATIGEKLRLFTRPQLSSSQYIEMERFLFDLGKYNSTINNGYGALSPAVELMLKHRNGITSDIQLEASLDSLAGYDIREQQLDFFYRNPINQQYQANMSGGNDGKTYFSSVGYDNSMGDVRTSSNDRFTVSANALTKLFGDKLEISSAIQLVNSRRFANGREFSPRYPYERVADDDGNALPVTDGLLSLDYVNGAGEGKLLDWYYRPLDENRVTNSMHTMDHRLNFGLTYKIVEPISIQLMYVNQRGREEQNRDFDKDSYYVRNMINSISQIDSETGAVFRPIPLGGIAEISNAAYSNHNGRGQLTYNSSWGESHQLNAIAGFEMRSIDRRATGNIFYGYRRETGSNLNQTIDYHTFYPYFYRTTTTRIQNGDIETGSIDRYRSVYANISYVLFSKYVLSASARKDESNLFGVKANQKGVPLWSGGLSWAVSKEPFYNFDFMPQLKIRATLGYNGNEDKSTSAYLTASTATGTNRYGSSYASIVNPPNPSLIWERVRNLNFGVDFSTRENRISGSIDLYLKEGKDLIGNLPTPAQVGITSFRGNSASLTTKGIDAMINTLNTRGKVTWTSTVLLNLVRERVTWFEADVGSNLDVVRQNFRNPLVGYPYNSIFSFQWAGLDNKGNAQGYLANEISKEYALIVNSKDRDELIYHGSGTPTLFGSFRNDISWNNLSLSFNILYKSRYYFRRSSLDHLTLINGGFLMPDYEKRWQTAGDELLTDVPAVQYPANSRAASLYQYADILVERGDHIRLQDIRMNFRIDPGSRLFRSFHVFAQADNLGIIWSKNKKGIDPDSQFIKLSKSLSLGFRAIF